MITFIFSTFLLFLSNFAVAQECPKTKIVKQGKVTDTQINEVSGLVVGEKYLWVHNDSGDGPFIYALEKTGEFAGKIEITNAFAKDWEDMTSFFHENKRYFLIGDTGDNKERKSSVTFYVIEEPSNFENREYLYSFTGSYGDLGPKDVEAMFVDPATNHLILVTKGRDGYFHWLDSAFPLPNTPETKKNSTTSPPVHITFASLHSSEWHEIPLSNKDQSKLRTSASVYPQKKQDGSTGNWIVVRNYLSAQMWYQAPNQDLPTTLAQVACRIPLPMQPQGETLQFSVDGNALWTISEGTTPNVYQILVEWE